MFITKQLERLSSERHDEPFLHYRNTFETYGKFYHKVLQTAAYLQERGLKYGDVLCCALPNSYELFLGISGALQAGGQVCLLPRRPKTTWESIARYHKETGEGLVLTTTDRGFNDKIPRDRIIVTDLYSRSRDEFMRGVLRNSSSAYSDVEISPRDTAFLIPTSGSTGRPKLARIPHQVLETKGLRYAEAFGLNETSKVGVVIPLFHSFGLNSQFLAPLVSGCQIRLDGHRFDNERTLYIIDSQQVTHFPALPYVLKTILDASIMSGIPLESVQRVLCGGDRIPKNLIDLCLQEGLEASVIYGSTETGLISTLDFRDHYNTLIR